MSRRNRSATYAGLALAATLALSGCDGQSTNDAGSTPTDGSTTSNPPPSTPATTDESTEQGGTTETSPTTAGPTTRDDSSTARARQSKVPMRRMPGFNEPWTWDGVTSRSGEPPEGPARSRCQRAPLTAIGAVAEYTTTYTRSDAPDDAAALTTGVFPDEQTATMAESVLAKWLATCRSNVRKQPGVERAGVSADSTVDTVVGPGHQRLLGYGPVEGDPDAGYFNGEGYALTADQVAAAATSGASASARVDTGGCAL